MNDINSKLRKIGVWIWNQKEKMFLGALLVVLCFRVWIVLNPPAASAAPTTGATATAGTTKAGTQTAKPGTKAAPAPASEPSGKKLAADAVPDPQPKPVSERPEDFRPLVRQNPFTIYSAMSDGQNQSDSEGDSIDVTLNGIMKWSDGAYRAELTTKVSGKSKRYKEGEVFENYKLMTIDPQNKSVTIYSSAHDKTFELKIP